MVGDYSTDDFCYAFLGFSGDSGWGSIGSINVKQTRYQDPHITQYNSISLSINIIHHDCLTNLSIIFYFPLFRRSLIYLSHPPLIQNIFCASINDDQPRPHLTHPRTHVLRQVFGDAQEGTKVLARQKAMHSGQLPQR